MGRNFLGLRMRAQICCNSLIACALYGLKSSGASWRHQFAAEIRSMGFKDTKAHGVRNHIKRMVLHTMNIWWYMSMMLSVSLKHQIIG